MKIMPPLSCAQYYKIMESSLFCRVKPLGGEQLMDIIVKENLFDPTRLKIILFNTPAKDYTKHDRRGQVVRRFPPLGLFYLKSAIEQKFGEGSVLIVNMDDMHLSPIDAAEIVRLVNSKCQSRPWVGVNMVLPNRYNAYRTVISVREKNPYNFIVMGGKGITIEKAFILKEFPKELTETPIYAVLGDAQQTLSDVLDGDFNSPNLAWVREGKFVPAEKDVFLSLKHFCSFPPPLAPPYLATQGVGWYYMILSSLSCSARCDFCAARFTPYRILPLIYVNNIIKYVLKQYSNSANFNFADDNVLVSHDRALKVINLMQSLNIGKYRVLARADDVVKLSSLLGRAYQSGLEEIAIGAESANTEILRMMNKQATLQIIRQAIHLIQLANIRVKAFYMIGYEDESEEQITATLREIENMKNNNLNLFRYSLFVAAPYCGTGLYYRLRDSGKSFWDLQLYTEAASTGSPALVDHVVKREIQISELCLERLVNFKDGYDNY